MNARSRLSLAQAVLAFALFVTAAVAGGANTRTGSAGTRILFVGNSLTIANDLPRMVEALSRSSGGPQVTCTVVAFPNYSLEDHWTRGDAVRAIERGGWTFVVLQQGPSALPESRVELLEYARRFNVTIRQAGARPALFMVWPAAARRADFDSVRSSYESAAKEIGGVFLPVGMAWRAVWKRDPAFELYGPDGFHPTRDGSYLAALVIDEHLSGRSAVSAARSFPMPAARAAVLHEAAAEVSIHP